MLTVTDDVRVDASIERVFETFWQPELWPRITPHVKQVEMLLRGARSQRFRMVVESNGRRFESESARTAEPHELISYVQIKTPPIFVRHCGDWRFSVDETGMTRVSLVHQVLLADEAPAILGTVPGQPTETFVADSLRRNGSLTMHALKRWIEALPSRGAA